MKFLIKALLVGSLVSVSSAANAETIWENYSIELVSGNTIYAVIERNQDCFNLLVGSNDTNISGTAANCSKKLKESVWSVSACGNRKTLSYHGPWDAIEAIVEMCN